MCPRLIAQTGKSAKKSSLFEGAKFVRLFYFIKICLGRPSIYTGVSSA